MDSDPNYFKSLETIMNLGKLRRLECALALTIGLCLLAANAAAMDSFFIGPRAMGMAGANVASTTDTTAQYYNPAAFGFFNRTKEPAEGSATRIESDSNNMGRKSWGLGLGAAAGYRLHNEFGLYIDDLSKIDYQRLSTDGLQSRSDLEDLIRLFKNLEGLDNPGNGVSATINGNLGVRINHFGIGALALSEASGQVISLDTANLGFSMDAATVGSDIANIDMSGTSYDSTGYTMQVFTPAQVSELCGTLGDPTCTTTLEAVQRLDYIASQQNINSSDVQTTVELLNNSIGQSGTGTSLANNTTTVLLKGFGVLEVPISYGYALNDHISFGGNLKFMRGRVYANEVLVFDDNSGDTLSKSDEYYEESSNFGIDLGVMARMDKLSFGLVGRNLNSPKFDGFTKTVTVNGSPVTITADDVKIRPQVAAGLAYIPFETLTLETDIDLTRNATTFSDYRTQKFSVGLEWDAFRVLALRLGGYKNLAESDIGWVYTAGLGLNLWAARLDIAGAFAGEKTRFDDKDYPKETRASLQLSVDF